MKQSVFTISLPVPPHDTQKLDNTAHFKEVTEEITKIIGDKEILFMSQSLTSNRIILTLIVK